MSADQIAENFSLDEACKIATCDKCGKNFDVDFYGDIQDHFLSHEKRREVN